MPSAKWFLRIAGGVRFEKIKECLDRSHEISGRSKFVMFFDMVGAAVKHGAGYYDYMMYGFFDKNVKRDTYLTRIRNKKLLDYMNDAEIGQAIDNKNEFQKKFSQYMKRDFLDGRTASYEEFEAFMADKESAFAKPESGDSGRGVEKLYKKDYNTLKDMYDYIKSKGDCAIEECIIQHPEMNRLYPHAINCMRVVTDRVGDEVYVAYVILKCGNGGSVCDNSGQGGLICAVDKETGVVKSIATDDLIAHSYEKHPETGVEFKGFKIPMYDEAIAMCKEAALIVPEVRHIGWDVGLSDKGPVLVEGNIWAGTDLVQLYYNTPDGIGVLPFYRDLLPDLKF